MQVRRSFQLSALTGLVTGLLRARSPRECQQPAPALAGCDQDLRTFTFVQHDQDLAEQRTEEAFAGASERPVVNVAGWIPLSLVNLAWSLSVPSPALQGGVIDDVLQVLTYVIKLHAPWRRTLGRT